MPKHPTHSIRRTSPKGQDFEGVCVLCGETGLKMDDALKKCVNPFAIPSSTVVMDAITSRQ